MDKPDNVKIVFHPQNPDGTQSEYYYEVNKVKKTYTPEQKELLNIGKQQKKVVAELKKLEEMCENSKSLLLRLRHVKHNLQLFINHTAFMYRRLK